MKENLRNFLPQLLHAQNILIAVLQQKQDLLVHPQKDALEKITAEEAEAVERMRQIMRRREDILETARLQNIGGGSLEALCGHFFPRDFEMQKMLEEAKHRTQEIRLIAYTNWMMSRKSIVHLSQILEILSTDGQGKATYQSDSQADTGISRRGLINRVA